MSGTPGGIESERAISPLRPKSEKLVLHNSVASSDQMASVLKLDKEGPEWDSPAIIASQGTIFAGQISSDDSLNPRLQRNSPCRISSRRTKIGAVIPFDLFAGKRMFRRFDASDLSKLEPRRICLIKPSALGDVVQTIPLLDVLKRCYPQASISWVVNRELRDLIDGHPALTESIPFERRGGWADWVSLLQTLRQRRFDLTLDLQGLLRTGIMTAATGAPVRVGLQTAREGSRWTLNCVIPGTVREMAAHARYWRVAECLGSGSALRETFIATSESDQDWAERQLQELPRPIFAVHPGARWETKRWPVEKFAELLTRASATFGGSVLILGSKSEKPDADRLEQLLEPCRGSSERPRIVNLTGESTLKQLSALLNRVDFAISNDSGPMHLAAGLDVPTLGLFTCTSAIRSGPPGDQHEMASTTVSCAAGYHKTCPHRGEGHLACFRELDVERVWLALQRLVQKNGIKRKVA